MKTISNTSKKIKKGKLTVIAGPMFAGKTTKLLTLFSVLQDLEYRLLCFKAEASEHGGMGHTHSHDERPLAVIYIQQDHPELILKYVDNDGIEKVIIDAIHFFPKKSFLEVVKKLLANGIDVYCNGLIYDYKKTEYGATKSLMAIADESIEQYSICVRCGSRAEHTERISGGTKLSVGTVGRTIATYIPVCASCHKIYKG
jgi:thymidine kinase